MWLFIRSLALAFLLAGYVTASWPAAQWLSESDQWQHRGERHKRQDSVTPPESPPLESGSASQWEESSAAEEDSSSDGNEVTIEETGGNSGEDGGFEGSSEEDLISSEGGSGPVSELIEELEDNVLEEEVNAEAEWEAETTENGKLAEGSGDSGVNHEESGNTSGSGEPENGHGSGGSGDIESDEGFLSGNSGEEIPAGQDDTVEEEVVLDEISVEAEAVHGEEASEDDTVEAEEVGPNDVGNHTDESQDVYNVMDKVENIDGVEDTYTVEDFENVGSDLGNNTDGGNFEYEDGNYPNGEDGEPETSLESPRGVDSGAICCCCNVDLS